MVGQNPAAWRCYALICMGLALGCQQAEETRSEPTQVRVAADTITSQTQVTQDAENVLKATTEPAADIQGADGKIHAGAGEGEASDVKATEPIKEAAEDSAPARDEEPPKAPKCTKQGKALKVYAVGSSTMAGLAFVMRKPLTKRGVDFQSGAKPSSGLSRPDFFDWPAEIPKIVKRVDPDVFVVSMGTNDNQAVRLADRSWVRPNKPKWEEVYRSRVRAMLEGMNEGRQRRIIWIGPNSVHGRKKGSRRYRINEMMRDEVTRFAGDTHYIDLYRLITHEKSGRVRRLIQRKSDGRYFKARAKDGVHLSLPALRFLLAEEVYQALEPCFSEAGLKRRLAHPTLRTPRRSIDLPASQVYAKR